MSIQKEKSDIDVSFIMAMDYVSLKDAVEILSGRDLARAGQDTRRLVLACKTNVSLALTAQSVLEKRKPRPLVFNDDEDDVAEPMSGISYRPNPWDEPEALPATGTEYDQMTIDDFCDSFGLRSSKSHINRVCGAWPRLPVPVYLIDHAIQYSKVYVHDGKIDQEGFPCVCPMFYQEEEHEMILVSHSDQYLDESAIRQMSIDGDAGVVGCCKSDVLLHSVSPLVTDVQAIILKTPTRAFAVHFAGVGIYPNILEIEQPPAYKVYVENRAGVFHYHSRETLTWGPNCHKTVEHGPSSVLGYRGPFSAMVGISEVTFHEGELPVVLESTSDGMVGDEGEVLSPPLALVPGVYRIMQGVHPIRLHHTAKLSTISEYESRHIRGNSRWLRRKLQLMAGVGSGRRHGYPPSFEQLHAAGVKADEYEDAMALCNYPIDPVAVKNYGNYVKRPWISDLRAELAETPNAVRTSTILKDLISRGYCIDHKRVREILSDLDFREKGDMWVKQEYKPKHPGQRNKTAVPTRVGITDGTNYKGEVFAWCQKHRVPQPPMTSFHDGSEYVVGIELNGIVFKGTGRRVKDAEQGLCKVLLNEMRDDSFNAWLLRNEGFKTSRPISGDTKIVDVAVNPNVFVGLANIISK